MPAKPDGTVDAANSTQFISLYTVAGANAGRPALVQVLKQPNAHVGLVFSHDGSTLYAAGGNDDAVYVFGLAAPSARLLRLRSATLRPARPAVPATKASA